MNIHANKAQENKNPAVSSNLTKQKSSSQSMSQFVDNRPETIAQRKLQEIANNSSQVQQLQTYQTRADNFISQRKGRLEEEIHQGKSEPIQKKKNNTFLPDKQKSSIERLSGYSIDDVKVSPNSNKPAQLEAHTYAQGRVQPTTQMKQDIPVTNNPRSEHKADVLGENAKKTFEEDIPSFKDTLSLKKSDVIQARYKSDSEVLRDSEELESPRYSSFLNAMIKVIQPESGGVQRIMEISTGDVWIYNRHEDSYEKDSRSLMVDPRELTQSEDLDEEHLQAATESEYLNIKNEKVTDKFYELISRPPFAKKPDSGLKFIWQVGERKFLSLHLHQRQGTARTVNNCLGGAWTTGIEGFVRLNFLPAESKLRIYRLLVAHLSEAELALLPAREE